MVRAPDGTVERVVETKAAGDATGAELRIREVNTGIYAFDGGALPAALAGGERRQRPGRALPARRAADPAGARAHVAAHEISDPTSMLGVNDRVQLATRPRVAQRRIHERHMLAGVTIVDPAPTVIDAGVKIGQDTVDRAVHQPARHDEHRPRATIGPAPR